MEARETSLSFLIGDQTQFIIPFFQRAYVWDEENWERLLDSLRSGNSSHYLGSIIVKLGDATNDEGFYYREVIDGQQRITTLSILMRALCDNLNTSAVRNVLYGKLFCRRDTTKKYEAKAKGQNNSVVKLVLGFYDKDAFTQLIENPEVAIQKYPNSQIVKCYQYFLTATADKKVAKKIYTLLNNETIKFIVKIELGANDNAQAIFDVSNGTGVLLTCADIIKNDLFLHLPEKNRLNAYKENWEQAFDTQETYEFWSTYYSTRTNIENLLFAVAQIEKFGEGYIYDATSDTYETLSNKYRKFFDAQSEKQLNAFIKRLVKYSRIYKKHLTIDAGYKYSEDDIVPRAILAFSRLNACTVLFPYLLKLFNQHCDDEGEIISDHEKNLADSLRTVERLLLRAAIASNASYIDKNYKPSPKNFNRNIAKVINSMNVEELYTASQLSSINDDNKVKEGLLNVDNNTASIVLFLLNLKIVASMEETANVKEYAYNYELEHIMPQAFVQHWGLPEKDIFGNPIPAGEEEQYRQSFVYQIGNMTIITPKANKIIKNFSIKVKMDGDTTKKTKKDIRKGYQGYEMFASEPISSRFKADIIKNSYVWNEKMISERTELLTGEILLYWK